MREVTLIDYASNPTASWQKSDRDTALRKLLCDILGSPTAKGYAHGKLIWMFKDARGRRVTPTERRQQVVQAFRASGLTMAAFARRERLKYGKRPPECLRAMA